VAVEHRPRDQVDVGDERVVVGQWSARLKLSSPRSA
jgi:hypothetical protein